MKHRTSWPPESAEHPALAPLDDLVAVMPGVTGGRERGLSVYSRLNLGRRSTRLSQASYGQPSQVADLTSPRRVLGST